MERLELGLVRFPVLLKSEASSALRVFVLPDQVLQFL
jgi:hypothetical protein